MTYADNTDRLRNGTRAEGNWRLAIRLISKRKWLIGAFALAAMIAGMIAIRLTTPTYVSELRVVPASTARSGSDQALGTLGGLASMAGLSLGRSEASPFDLYIDALTSRTVADALAENPRILKTIFKSEWNEKSAQWQEPSSAGLTFRKALARAVGQPAAHYRQPDGARLQRHVAEKLLIERSTKTPVTSLRYQSSDPIFASYFLSELHRAADRKVKRRSLIQAREYSIYLQNKLRSVTVSDYREVLLGGLSEQEKMIMMASSRLPYSATPLENPVAPDAPSSPRPLLILLAAVVSGALLGMLIALTIGLSSRSLTSSDSG